MSHNYFVKKPLLHMWPLRKPRPPDLLAYCPLGLPGAPPRPAMEPALPIMVPDLPIMEPDLPIMEPLAGPPLCCARAPPGARPVPAPVEDDDDDVDGAPSPHTIGVRWRRPRRAVCWGGAAADVTTW